LVRLLRTANPSSGPGDSYPVPTPPPLSQSCDPWSRVSQGLSWSGSSGTGSVRNLPSVPGKEGQKINSDDVDRNDFDPSYSPNSGDQGISPGSHRPLKGPGRRPGGQSGGYRDEMTNKAVADLTRCLGVGLNQKILVEGRKESPRMGQRRCASPVLRV